MIRLEAWVVRVALLVGLLGVASAWADEGHPAKGLVLTVDEPHRSIVISCEAIPGYMAAMEMPFTVSDVKVLAGLNPGTMVRFTMVKRGKVLFADDIQQGTSANFEAEPMEAGNLTALHTALDPSAAAKIVTVGQPVPDFALADQAGKEIHLSQLQGKVVALTFGYSRCPNPDYCFRLSNNLASLEKRFHEQARRNLALITIVIDPENDQGSTLIDYAGLWKTDPAVWHFLTGPLPEVKKVAGLFGMNFWNGEGALTHTLHTVIIDRNGHLAANLDGNQFTKEELGDLVQTVMDRP